MATQRSGLGSCQTAGGGGGASYIPGLLTQDCRAHLRSPKFSLQKEALRIEAWHVQGQRVWGGGGILWGDICCP